MAKKNMKRLISAVQWVSKTLIGLGLGFYAISGGLVIPNIPVGLMTFAGWVVVISTTFDAGNTIMESR